MGRISFMLALVCVAVASACGGSDDGGLFGDKGGASGSGGAAGSAGSSGAAGGAAGSSGSSAVGGSGGAGAQGGVGAQGGGGAQGGAAGGGQGGASGVGGEGAQGGASGDAGSAGLGGSGGDGGSGGSGGSPNQWCKGVCGTSSPVTGPTGAACFCDEQCISSGDCCPDYGPACNPTAGAGEVKCGTIACSTATNICCQTFVTGGLNPLCVPTGATCVGPDIECDGPEDCPGAVCCSTPSGGSNNVNFECRATADCDDSSQRIVCGNDASVCGPNQVCLPHPWVPQYNYCATQN